MSRINGTYKIHMNNLNLTQDEAGKAIVVDPSTTQNTWTIEQSPDNLPDSPVTITFKPYWPKIAGIGPVVLPHYFTLGPDNHTITIEENTGDPTPNQYWTLADLTFVESDQSEHSTFHARIQSNVDVILQASVLNVLLPAGTYPKSYPVTATPKESPEILELQTWKFIPA